MIYLDEHLAGGLRSIQSLLLSGPDYSEDSYHSVFSTYEQDNSAQVLQWFSGIHEVVLGVSYESLNFPTRWDLVARDWYQQYQAEVPSRTIPRISCEPVPLMGHI